MLFPIYDRRQYGSLALANPRNRGCHIPKRIRGASAVSQLGCADITSCINAKSLSGSFCTLTSTLNLTCIFSGCVGNLTVRNAERIAGRTTDLHEQSYRLCKCGDRLLGLLDGPDVLHSIVSIPRPLFYFPCANRTELLSATQFLKVHNMLPLTFRVRCSSEGYNSKRKTQLNKAGQGATQRGGGIPGSWNMMTTSSDDTWTSRRGVTRGVDFIRHMKYRFRCPRHHLGWRPQSWQVCSRESGTRPGDEISTDAKYME